MSTAAGTMAHPASGVGRGEGATSALAEFARSDEVPDERVCISDDGRHAAGCGAATRRRSERGPLESQRRSGPVTRPPLSTPARLRAVRTCPLAGAPVLIPCLINRSAWADIERPSWRARASSRRRVVAGRRTVRTASFFTVMRMYALCIQNACMQFQFPWAVARNRGA